MNDLTPNPPHRNIQTYVFAAILIVLFIMVCRLFAPFFTALLWSTLLYVLLIPLHRRVIGKLDLDSRKGRVLKNIWAVVFTLGAMVIILIPLSFVASLFFQQIVDLLRYGRDAFSQRPESLQEFLNKVSAFVRDITMEQVDISGDEILRQITAMISTGLQSLLSMSSTVARNVGGFGLTIVLIMFSLFFFFVDGAYLSRLFLHAIPIRKEYLAALTGKFMDITRNLVFGYIMVALVQAVMAYIIFSIFQVRGALVFAALTFICVFIPMIGGGLVWLPLGLVRIIGGNVGGGILFLVVAGLFISMLDNVLRPMFLKDRIHLHPLIIFFAILGGVSVFGFNGIIMGPMVVILFLTVLDLFLTEHKIKEE